MLFDRHRLVVVLFKIDQDGRTLIVKRGEYSCFPGGPIRDSEDIDDFALKVLPCYVIRPYSYRPRHMVADRFDGTWNDVPASILVVEYPREEFILLSESGGRWVDLCASEENFDIFVRKFLENRERDRQFAESCRMSA